MATTERARSPPLPTAGGRRDLPSLLAAARPFLRGEIERVDPELPALMSVLRAAGAGECYHKHGTFLAHLADVHRILHLWGAPAAVARCGLFHSAYSNSYVNLAIFEPDVGRDRVRGLIGAAAERLVHLFCVVPRHPLIHDDLLFKYSDAELAGHLAASEASVRAAAADPTEPWREKLRSVLPEAGAAVRHIRTGEPVALPRRVVAAFLLLTLADFSDQYTDYYDQLFGNANGRLQYRGDNWGALWPGTGKPGLWMHAMSRVAALYTLILRDEHLRHRPEADGRDEDIELPIPPVFDGCSKVLDAGEQKAARDLYWEAVCSEAESEEEWEGVERLLVESVGRNPYVGEPRLVLAQVRLNMGRYEAAEAEGEAGVRLLLEWGSSWDKRVSWEGWVSWGRVLLAKARDRDWPHTAWGIVSLGLVK